MARTITEERRVLTGNLHTVPIIEELFRRHKYEWMARALGNYSEDITWEFYASYAAMVRNAIPKRAKPLAQPPLQSTLVRNIPVDIYEATICRFIYGPAHTLPINIADATTRYSLFRVGYFRGMPSRGRHFLGGWSDT
uniref:Integrase core domain containing protein n=1 Tax=Solanum tuberosum TaxID=4113 RepID=M1DB15_SOLTU